MTFKKLGIKLALFTLTTKNANNILNPHPNQVYIEVLKFTYL